VDDRVAIDILDTSHDGVSGAFVENEGNFSRISRLILMSYERESTCASLHYVLLGFRSCS
jgi:hypothetical protein